MENALELSIAGFSNEIYSYLGDCYRVKKNYEEAVDDYKLSLTLKPDNIKVINNLSSVFHDNIKDKKALARFYEEFLSRHRDLDKTLRDEIKARQVIISY